MATPLCRRLGFVWIALLVIASVAVPAHADEIWVAPTYQQDIGGLGVASNAIWPVTPIGVVRLAWSIPDDLQTFQTAKVAIIPSSPGGASTLNIFVCPAQNGNAVAAACGGPFTQAFTGVTNQLVEVDISSLIASRIGTPGANYLAVLAYTTPTTSTDHIVGLRFSYAPNVPTGVATLAANTFTGTQTAPAFVGSGAGLTNLPAANLTGVVSSGNLPIGSTAGTVAAGNDPRLSDARLPLAGSPNYIQNGSTPQAASFNVTGNATIGNLNFPNSSATTGNLTKNGLPFLHNFGVSNTFLGQNAGNLTMSGSGNTASGVNVLLLNTTGSSNTASGAGALSSNTSGGGNTASGLNALLLNTTGSSNTAIGVQALLRNITGDSNVAIGQNAGANANTGSNNIYLGANVLGVSGEANAMYLGLQGTQTKTFIAGIRGITTVNNDAIPVMIDSAGQIGTISSSIRFKEDIHDMADTSRRLFDLRPVTFRYTKPYGNGSKPIQFGLVAEEVAQVFPELAVHDANGNVETVHYETLSVLLLNEAQRQERQRQEQQAQIDELRQQVADLLHRFPSEAESRRANPQ
jgi:hypothetical protein